VPSLRAFI